MKLFIVVVAISTLAACASSRSAPHLLTTLATMDGAPVSPEHTHLDQRVCKRVSATRDLRVERADVAEATRHVEAEYKQRLDALDQTTAGPRSLADERALSDFQHAYNRAKFIALYPLAARGNSVAIYDLSSQYKWADSGFNDLPVR